jgi:hypothetical protein
MGLLSRLEQALFTGKIVKDYGLLSEGRYGAANRTITALVTQRDDVASFVIKSSYKALLSARVQYLDLDREGALKWCTLRRARPPTCATLPFERRGQVCSDFHRAVGSRSVRELLVLSQRVRSRCAGRSACAVEPSCRPSVLWAHDA